ncbi:MAG: hypothetical protein CO113_01340 [Elusimicrobia bacterium CG_4_9_14_3_um_filter_62_55]|nr:MAG: hypothetical protein COX66_17990 [Elusimicrobia bacterium CG_4_10_14_0_2_um_filter_63_34]PJB26915.1 MAG: hypothetical protein CO113_01340 [Elusimicrobia bacterium CG_4_9_14_3_um_filter_62_55]
MIKKYSTSFAAGLVLAGSTVAGAASSNARYQPSVIDCGYIPSVVYLCEDGSRAWFDWETCKFRCDRKRPRKPWVDPAPYDPYRGYRDDKKFNEHMKGMENGVADLRDAVGSGNISGASTQLGGFYSGAASLGTVSAAGAVRAPKWKTEFSQALSGAARKEKEETTIFNPPPPAQKPRPKRAIESFEVAQAGPIIREVGKAILKSGAVEAAKEAGRKANKAVEDHVNRDRTRDMIDKYGGTRMDHLKSKNK